MKEKIKKVKKKFKKKIFCSLRSKEFEKKGFAIPKNILVLEI